MTKLISYFESLNKILDTKEINTILYAYNQWVVEQPSIIDGDPNVSQPHHVRTPDNSGTGIKPSDVYKVPITYEQHTAHHTGNHNYQTVFIDNLPDLHERFLAETDLYWLVGKVEFLIITNGGLMFSEETKKLLIENVRGASKIKKATTSKEEFEDVFELMARIDIANGDIIESALINDGIDTHEKILERKATDKIGVLIHDITLNYVKSLLMAENG